MGYFNCFSNTKPTLLTCGWLSSPIFSGIVHGMMFELRSTFLLFFSPPRADQIVGGPGPSGRGGSLLPPS